MNNKTTEIYAPQNGKGVEALHEWWELSYAQYLTIPRTAMQSMPDEWQGKMAKLLNELDERIDWRPQTGCYWCLLRGADGRYMEDPLANYERGRRRLPLKPKVRATLRQWFFMLRFKLNSWWRTR